MGEAPLKNHTNYKKASIFIFSSRRKQWVFGSKKKAHSNRWTGLKWSVNQEAPIFSESLLLQKYNISPFSTSVKCLWSLSVWELSDSIEIDLHGKKSGSPNLYNVYLYSIYIPQPLPQGKK